MRLRKIVILLALTAMLLGLRSSCGTTAQENVQTVNYYHAVHQVPRNNAGIKIASIMDRTLYQNLLGTMNSYMQQSRGSFRGIQALEVSTDGIAVMTVDFLFKIAIFPVV